MIRVDALHVARATAIGSLVVFLRVRAYRTRRVRYPGSCPPDTGWPVALFGGLLPLSMLVDVGVTGAMDVPYVLGAFVVLSPIFVIVGGWLGRPVVTDATTWRLRDPATHARVFE